jgi:hypothetical protein
MIISDLSPKDVRIYGEVSGNAARLATRPPREVYKIALLECESVGVILKLYGMIKQGEKHIPYDLVIERAEFIQQELLRRERVREGTGFTTRPRIRLETGMGYAILSSRGGTLLLTTWGNTKPHISNTYLYTGDTTRKAMKREDINRAGDHCSWESGVAAYEAQGWLAFLASKRRAKDKKRYLDDFLTGLVFPELTPVLG